MTSNLWSLRCQAPTPKVCTIHTTAALALEPPTSTLPMSSSRRRGPILRFRHSRKVFVVAKAPTLVRSDEITAHGPSPEHIEGYREIGPRTPLPLPTPCGCCDISGWALACARVTPWW
jgi:hypothetical protein